MTDPHYPLSGIRRDRSCMQQRVAAALIGLVDKRDPDKVVVQTQLATADVRGTALRVVLYPSGVEAAKRIDEAEQVPNPDTPPARAADELGAVNCRPSEEMRHASQTANLVLAFGTGAKPPTLLVSSDAS